MSSRRGGTGDEAEELAPAPIRSPTRAHDHAAFGTFPDSAFTGLATVDHFTHAWDLARATGQSADLAPAMAEELLAAARGMISDDFRRPDGVAPFGPEVSAGGAACPADQLAAYLGRTV